MTVAAWVKNGTTCYVRIATDSFHDPRRGLSLWDWKLSARERLKGTWREGNKFDLKRVLIVREGAPLHTAGHTEASAKPHLTRRGIGKACALPWFAAMTLRGNLRDKKPTKATPFIFTPLSLTGPNKPILACGQPKPIGPRTVTGWRDP